MVEIIEEVPGDRIVVERGSVGTERLDTIFVEKDKNLPIAAVNVLVTYDSEMRYRVAGFLNGKESPSLTSSYTHLIKEDSSLAPLVRFLNQAFSRHKSGYEAYHHKAEAPLTLEGASAILRGFAKQKQISHQLAETIILYIEKIRTPELYPLDPTAPHSVKARWKEGGLSTKLQAPTQKGRGI